MSRADNKEKYKEYDHQYYIKHKRPKSKIGQAEQQISDLEAKLAEKEEINKLANEQLEDMERSKLAWENKYFKLEKQLAEKDKDIKYLKESYYMIQDEKDHYAGQCLNLQDRIEELEKIINESFHNQDKISFAVEQLEKVKKDIDCYMAIREGDLPYNIECLLLDFADKIDNQIKELKGE